MKVERWAGPLFLVTLCPLRLRCTKAVCRATLLLLLGGPLALIAAFCLLEPCLLAVQLEQLPAWAVSVLGSVLILISCVLHELAHGMAAAAFRGETEEIGLVLLLLLPVGMYLSYQETPKTTRFGKYGVSVAGVCANSFAALLFLLLAGHAGVLGEPFLLAGVGNLILVAVNLLPGSLLDGGHIFEALTGIKHIHRRALHFIFSSEERRRVRNRGIARAAGTVTAYLIAGIGQIGMVAWLGWSVVSLFL